MDEKERVLYLKLADELTENQERIIDVLNSSLKLLHKRLVEEGSSNIGRDKIEILMLVLASINCAAIVSVSPCPAQVLAQLMQVCANALEAYENRP